VKANAAIAGALAWGLATQPRAASRLSHRALETLMERSGLKEEMQRFGLWDSFQDGTRGRRR
jgi:hypothetical protein